jgi:hypothetical protein
VEWGALVLLGAYHGINPGMGWLFAVALGMQQGTARGVLRALPPIALGHGLAVGAVLVAAASARVLIPAGAIKVIVAAILIAFGVYRLGRHRHRVYGGMQAGFRDLTIWSFLMASAHGAGFMVLPVAMDLSADVEASAASHAHLQGLAAPQAGWMWVAALGVHTLAYLSVTALLAWVIYSRVGLAVLRTAWFNLDWLWAFALVVTGVVVLVI